MGTTWQTLALSVLSTVAPTRSLRCGAASSWASRAPHSRLGPLNVWSNSQAIQDYQNLLSGNAPSVYSDRPSCFVIGTGPASTEEAKLGKWLMALNPRGDDVTVDALSVLPATMIFDQKDGPDKDELGSFPIYMCVGPDELEAAIDAIPPAKRGDCVIVNDGFIEPILEERAMSSQEQTQCVFYVSVNEYGVGFDQRVSLGDAQGGEYAAETTVTGKWAGAVEERLTRHNFFARTMSYRDWRKVMLEKVAFYTVFPLVGALHPKEDGSPSSLADVADYFDVEAADMVCEMHPRGSHYEMLGGYTGCPPRPAAALRRMFAYATSEHTHTPAVVDAWRWRNGVRYDLSQQALKRDSLDHYKMHTEYLEYGKDNGLIACEGFAK